MLFQYYTVYLNIQNVKIMKTAEKILELYANSINSKNYTNQEKKAFFSEMYAILNKQAKEICADNPEKVYLITLDYERSMYEEVKFISGSFEQNDTRTLSNEATIIVSWKKKPITVMANRLVKI